MLPSYLFVSNNINEIVFLRHYTANYKLGETM